MIQTLKIMGVCVCVTAEFTPNKKRGLEIGKSHKIEGKEISCRCSEYVDSCMCKSRQAA